MALCVAPVYWRSGRFAANEFVFYGPAGEDHLYHLTLLQRLLHHVPPDNFVVSGMRAPVYHFFDDLTLALILRMQSTLHLHTNLFDLYYRCYPVLIYFLIGALAYRIGRQWFGRMKGGLLSLLLLLGAGGLGSLVGALQAAAHFRNGRQMIGRLFTDWASWDSVGSVLSLVHRPAQYHSLLLSLAALSLLLRKERSGRDWALAGLLLGLMAGFNFTLAATFGVAAVIAFMFFLVRKSWAEARELGTLAVSAFVGSLPVNASMILSGFHETAPGFPFWGPNLEFPVSHWGNLMVRLLPHAAVPMACLLLFVIVAYGVRLFGLAAMARFDLGGAAYRPVAALLTIVFSISFVVGTFLTYQGIGLNVVFLQPTLWIMSLFCLASLWRWLQQVGKGMVSIAFWTLLFVTLGQSLLAFNYSFKVAFDTASMQVFRSIHDDSQADDVIAYLPSNLKPTPILGPPGEFPDYAVMAMTGLDGYFLSEEYSEFYAIPGLKAHTADEAFRDAANLYQQRKSNVEEFLKGNTESQVLDRLGSDHVRWIVLLHTAGNTSSNIKAWAQTSQLTVYALPQAGR